MTYAVYTHVDDSTINDHKQRRDKAVAVGGHLFDVMIAAHKLNKTYFESNFIVEKFTWNVATPESFNDDDMVLLDAWRAWCKDVTVTLLDKHSFDTRTTVEKIEERVYLNDNQQLMSELLNEQKLLTHPVGEAAFLFASQIAERAVGNMTSVESRRLICDIVDWVRNVAIRQSAPTGKQSYSLRRKNDDTSIIHEDIVQAIANYQKVYPLNQNEAIITKTIGKWNVGLTPADVYELNRFDIDWRYALNDAI